MLGTSLLSMSFSNGNSFSHSHQHRVLYYSVVETNKDEHTSMQQAVT